MGRCSRGTRAGPGRLPLPCAPTLRQGSGGFPVQVASASWAVASFGYRLQSGIRFTHNGSQGALGPSV